MPRFELEPTTAPQIYQGRGAGGPARLCCDGRPVGSRLFETSAPLLVGIEGLSCGYAFAWAYAASVARRRSPPARPPAAPPPPHFHPG